MTEYYYFFDCLDGILGEKYLTPSDVAELQTGKREALPETELKKIARNYEATLYRYEKSEDGSYTNGACIYDPYGLEKTYTKTECGSWDKD